MALKGTTTYAAPAWLKALPMILIGAGGLGCLLGGFANPQQLGFSYLLAYMFFLSICLGGLFLVLVHHLFDASWSVPIRRFCEHIAFLLPVMALLFLPIALLSKHIYPWMSILPADDHALYAKKELVNPAGFFLATLIIFAVWTVLSWRLRHWSILQDKTGAVACTRAMRVHAAWGIFAFALTLTMAAILWMKSLQHHWFSTMYGVYYFAGSVWTSLATFYVIALVLQRTGPLRGVVHNRQFHDLGALLFAFTVFYAYIHFSQYFLIWNAAIPEETFWYVLRETGSWWDVGMIIVFGHFALPFLFLLRIDAKLAPWVVVPLAVWAWIMHFLDMSFNITPVLQVFRNALGMEGELAHNMTVARPDGFAMSWMDFASLAFIGGVLALVFLKYLAAHAPYPVRDPRLRESMADLGHVTDQLAAEAQKGAD